ARHRAARRARRAAAERGLRRSAARQDDRRHARFRDRKTATPASGDRARRYPGRTQPRQPHSTCAGHECLAPALQGSRAALREPPRGIRRGRLRSGERSKACDAKRLIAQTMRVDAGGRRWSGHGEPSVNVRFGLRNGSEKLPLPRPLGAERRLCTAANGYSITSPAWASSIDGTVSPRDLAAFRLITKSNLVGCNTGKSAGFAPLRMRPAYAPAFR